MGQDGMAGQVRQRMFMRRTGRVLAVTRLVLAIVFLLAVVVEPTQPARAALAGLALLSAYMALAAAQVAIAWRSWWFDLRLARIAHLVDICAFVAGVYFTETNNSDFSSPFMAFAAFLLVSANLRWGWKGIAATALALLFANSVAGAVLYMLHFDLDLYRFSRRIVYMLVLSIVMVWLSSDNLLAQAIALADPGGDPGERRGRVLTAAMAQARQALGARGVAVALLRNEEPLVEIFQDDGTATHAMAAPGDLSDALAAGHPATLFDLRRGRRIELARGEGFVARTGPVSMPLARRCNTDEGISCAFSTASGPAELLVWGMRDITVDDMPLVEAFAREIGLALDREEMALLAQQAAVSGIRNALARDLHDSVAQFLAGTLFRIEALRRWIREGNDPEGEIDAIKQALRREQVQLRGLIDRLRKGEDGDRRTDLAEELDALLVELAHHWHIATRLDAAVRPLPVSIELAYELRQLVREGVANAVRHGHCSSVTVSIAGEAEALRLRIHDDGAGFPKGPVPLRPRSISERVEALGGQLLIADASRGVTLDISLPARMAA